MASPDSSSDHLGSLLEAISAARVGWFGIQDGKSFRAGAGVPEGVVPTNRLIWLEEGELAYRFEGEEEICREGGLWLVPEWTRRSWGTEGGCRMAWVEFATSPQVGALPMVTVEKRPWVNFHQGLIGETEKPFQEMALKLLLMHLLREGRWRNNPRAGDFSLHGVTEYLRRHLHESDLLGRLPEAVSISPRRLRDRFQNALGTTPGRYLEMLRMQQARYLLVSTEMSVKEVAGQTGFDDPLYFSRRYRRFWNHSPKAHRTPNP